MDYRCTIRQIQLIHCLSIEIINLLLTYIYLVNYHYYYHCCYRNELEDV